MNNLLDSPTLAPEGFPTLAPEVCRTEDCGATAHFEPITVGGLRSYSYERGGLVHRQYRAVLACPNGHRELRMIGRHYVGEAPAWYRQGEGTSPAAVEERRGDLCSLHNMERSVAGVCSFCE